MRNVDWNIFSTFFPPLTAKSLLRWPDRAIGIQYWKRHQSCTGMPSWIDLHWNSRVVTSSRKHLNLESWKVLGCESKQPNKANRIFSPDFSEAKQKKRVLMLSYFSNLFLCYGLAQSSNGANNINIGKVYNSRVLFNSSAAKYIYNKLLLASQIHSLLRTQ